MKKLSLLIIFIFWFFSIFSFANAKDWALELVLDLNYWPESEDILNIPSLWNYKFKNSDNTSKYKILKEADYYLRKEFIKKYRTWDFSKTNISWIENVYELFIYHTNKYFYFMSIKEAWANYKVANRGISENFKLSRTYLKELKKYLEK